VPHAPFKANGAYQSAAAKHPSFAKTTLSLRGEHVASGSGGGLYKLQAA